MTTAMHQSRAMKANRTVNGQMIEMLVLVKMIQMLNSRFVREKVVVNLERVNNLVFTLPQRAIQRRKVAFESKSVQIESYLADIEEREKEWLERDDAVKTDESKILHGQMAVPAAINIPKSNDNNEIKYDNLRNGSFTLLQFI